MSRFNRGRPQLKRYMALRDDTQFACVKAPILDGLRRSSVLLCTVHEVRYGYTTVQAISLYRAKYLPKGHSLARPSAEPPYKTSTGHEEGLSHQLVCADNQI